jgi:hypothetical protein
MTAVGVIVQLKEHPSGMGDVLNGMSESNFYLPYKRGQTYTYPLPWPMESC